MSGGDRAAADELLPILYAELHAIASRRLSRERSDHTLQATALVNEAWLRIFADVPPAFADRAHFLATASQAMRRILVDYARARSAIKRGGGLQERNACEDLELAAAGDSDAIRVLDLNEALDALAERYPQPARALEMHFFAGMTVEETAAAMNCTFEDVRHDLQFGRSWLRRRLASPPPKK